jgi:hypothetical protein
MNTPTGVVAVLGVHEGVVAALGFRIVGRFMAPMWQ